MTDEEFIDAEFENVEFSNKPLDRRKKDICDSETGERIFTKQGRGRPRKDKPESSLVAVKDTYLGYVVDKGSHIYTDEEIIECLKQKNGNIHQTAKYLQIAPQSLHERIRGNFSLQIARDEAREILNDLSEQKIIEAMNKGDLKACYWWQEHNNKNLNGSVNKTMSMNLNMNVELDNLSVEDLRDVESKLLSTINKT